MNRKLLILPALAAALLLAACGAEQTTSTAPEPDAHSHDQGAHGGAIVVLGDHFAHVEGLHAMADSAADIWVTDGNMKPLDVDKAPVLNLVTDEGSVRVTATKKGDGWRFVHESLAGHPEKARLTLVIGGKTYTPDLPHGHAHDDHDHAAHGAHDGTLAAFMAVDGSVAGRLELKLHDDKGDLELWLMKGEEGEEPFDLPLDAKLLVGFAKGPTKSVTLMVRNTDRNEDEDDVANNRNGKTNYFIFPGDTGADATFLMGAEYSNEVTVTFTKDGAAYATEVFTLKPHTPHAGHGHAHDDDEGHDHDGEDHDEHDHEGHDEDHEGHGDHD